MEQEEGLFPCLERCSTRIEQHWQTLWILLPVPSKQVHGEKKRKKTGEGGKCLEGMIAVRKLINL